MLILANDWCAKVYEEIYYSGWEYIISKSNNGSFFGTDKDNEVSSVKVNSGCTLKGYEGYHLNDLIFTYTNDEARLTMHSGQNDYLTSYTCTCAPQGMIDFSQKKVLKYESNPEINELL